MNPQTEAANPQTKQQNPRTQARIEPTNMCDSLGEGHFPSMLSLLFVQSKNSSL